MNTKRYLMPVFAGIIALTSVQLLSSCGDDDDDPTVEQPVNGGNGSDNGNSGAGQGECTQDGQGQPSEVYMFQVGETAYGPVSYAYLVKGQDSYDLVFAARELQHYMTGMQPYTYISFMVKPEEEWTANSIRTGMLDFGIGRPIGYVTFKVYSNETSNNLKLTGATAGGGIMTITKEGDEYVFDFKIESVALSVGYSLDFSSFASLSFHYKGKVEDLKTWIKG